MRRLGTRAVEETLVRKGDGPLAVKLFTKLPALIAPRRNTIFTAET